MGNLIKINEFFSSGSGSGSGNGYGYGNGYGSGSGSGSGYGNGTGSGDGTGSGNGSGDGSGSGYDYGYGSGNGSGSGYGYGSGSGSGYGYGYGYGSGSGSGSGISTFIGDMVYSVDGVPTIIDHVNRNVARGQILKADLSTEPCYVVKNGSLYAHGETLRDAMTALNEKTFDGMPEEERIAAFVAAHDDGKKYPNTDFFEWHHKLTGSCEIGRKAFAEDHCVDMSGEMSVMEFIELTEHDYGGQTIKKLRPYYTAEVKERSGGSR